MANKSTPPYTTPKTTESQQEEVSQVAVRDMDKDDEAIKNKKVSDLFFNGFF